MAKEQNPMDALKAAYCETARIDARVRGKLLKRARKRLGCAWPSPSAAADAPIDRKRPHATIARCHRL
jgi:hypothetical protein